MSTIERVANMLGAIPQPFRKPAAADEADDIGGPDLIERAVSKKALRPELREERSPDVKIDIAPARPADVRKSSRTITLDIAKLHDQNMITPDGSRSPITEGFRRIKRHVLANLANPGTGPAINLLMVTSPLAGEGKTFCTINLAISIAMEIDRRVLLVDADVAKPSVPRVLGIDADRGLMDVVLDRSIDLADVLLKTNIEGLSILPAGTQNQQATEMLASEAMRTLLKEMAERYHDRIIIFDSPPLLAASEASVLATRMGQIVVVVEAGKTTETELKDALSRIESCNLAGLLLNKGGAPGSGYYGGYGYGYGA
jgi:receptor protein-tyrosine kinase